MPSPVPLGPSRHSPRDTSGPHSSKPTPRAGAVPGSAVFVEFAAPDVCWCRDGTVTPTIDGVATYAPGGDEAPVTAYVVAPAGVAAADLVLRVSGLRTEAGSDRTGPWDRVTADRGGCPDDPAALCAPLG